jgi:hypothetical protein
MVLLARAAAESGQADLFDAADQRVQADPLVLCKLIMQPGAGHSGGATALVVSDLQHCQQPELLAGRYGKRPATPAGPE